MNYRYFRDKLLLMKAGLEQRLARTQKHITRTDGPLDPDFEEQAQEQQNDDVIYGLDDSARYEIEKINRALERIDNGEYGICVMCGGEIPEGRLDAVPYTDLCRDCADVEAAGKL